MATQNIKPDLNAVGKQFSAFVKGKTKDELLAELQAMGNVGAAGPSLEQMLVSLDALQAQDQGLQKTQAFFGALSDQLTQMIPRGDLPPSVAKRVYEAAIALRKAANLKPQTESEA